jgi:hypothetical protein
MSDLVARTLQGILNADNIDVSATDLIDLEASQV